PLYFLQRRIQFSRRNQLAREANALVEAYEMGRIIDMHRLAGSFEESAEIGNGRTLGIGPRHMDRGRQVVLRIARLFQERQHAIQAQIDQLWMQPRQAFQNGVGAGHWFVSEWRITASNLASPPGLSRWS